MSFAPAPLLYCPRLFDGWGMRTGVLLRIEGGRVAELHEICESTVPPQAQRLPADGVLAPGFIDTQVNGGGGVLFNDAPSLAGILTLARAHALHGTTSLLPTLITDTTDVMVRAIAAVRMAREQQVPGILGIHLEGPHLAPARPGIHRPELFTAPDAAALDLLGELETGHTLVTLAPECVPAGTVRSLRARGVLVFAGHTAASFEQVLSALAEGLDGFTHLYNAMTPTTGRAPGVVGAALLAPQAWVGLVLDGHHVAGGSVAVARAARGGVGRMLLVSDAMSVAGTDITRFELQGKTIHVRDGRCVDEAGTLAGASITLSDAVRIAHRSYGFTLEEALACAARHPAELLGLAHEIGVLRPGCRADAVFLDAQLRPAGVLQQGAWISRPQVVTA